MDLAKNVLPILAAAFVPAAYCAADAKINKAFNKIQTLHKIESVVSFLLIAAINIPSSLSSDQKAKYACATMAFTSLSKIVLYYFSRPSIATAN